MIKMDENELSVHLRHVDPAPTSSMTITSFFMPILETFLAPELQAIFLYAHWPSIVCSKDLSFHISHTDHLVLSPWPLSMLGRINGTITHATPSLDISDSSLTHSLISNSKFNGTGVINVLTFKSQDGEGNVGRVGCDMGKQPVHPSSKCIQSSICQGKLHRSVPQFTILVGSFLLCISLLTPSSLLPSLCP